MYCLYFVSVDVSFLTSPLCMHPHARASHTHTHTLSLTHTHTLCVCVCVPLSVCVCVRARRWCSIQKSHLHGRWVRSTPPHRLRRTVQACPRYVCLSVCLWFACLTKCLSVCMLSGLLTGCWLAAGCLYVYLYVCLSVCLCVCLSVCLLCLSVCLSLPAPNSSQLPWSASSIPPLCPSVSLSVCLSVCPAPLCSSARPAPLRPSPCPHVATLLACFFARLSLLSFSLSSLIISLLSFSFFSLSLSLLSSLSSLFHHPPLSLSLAPPSPCLQVGRSARCPHQVRRTPVRGLSGASMGIPKRARAHTHTHTHSRTHRYWYPQWHLQAPRGQGHTLSPSQQTHTHTRAGTHACSNLR